MRREETKPLAWYKGLRNLKERNAAGVFLVEGPRALSQIHAYHPEALKEILIDERTSFAETYAGMNTRILTPRQFASIATGKSPQGIIGVVALPEASYSSALPDHTGSRILFLEEVQDPGNVGSLIRSAAAFNFDGVLLSTGCADPFGPKCVGASAGAVLSLWIRRTDSFLQCLDSLKKKEYFCIATVLNQSMQPQYLRKEKMVLMLGNEGSGLSHTILERADAGITVPFNGQAVESLNIAAAGAVCMFLAGNT